MKKERFTAIPEYVMSYDDARRLASQLGISLDGLNGDDYAMCHHRFERFVRPVEAAVRLGIVAQPLMREDVAEMLLSADRSGPDAKRESYRRAGFVTTRLRGNA